eukprot:7891067-Pyramimonas_sp.AAC.1
MWRFADAPRAPPNHDVVQSPAGPGCPWILMSWGLNVRLLCYDGCPLTWVSYEPSHPLRELLRVPVASGALIVRTPAYDWGQIIRA